MHAIRQGPQAYFEMKTPMGADAHSSLIYHVVGTAAHVDDVTVAHRLLHDQETEVHGGATIKEASIDLNTSVIK